MDDRSCHTDQIETKAKRFSGRSLIALSVLAGAFGLFGLAYAGMDAVSAQPKDTTAKDTTAKDTAKGKAKETAESQSKKTSQPKKTEPAGKAAPKNPFPNRVKSQSLDGGTAWLNTSGEITLKDLRGKVVLLDFWTYCCINCMHVLPDLKYLEKKYDKELVVIGVHSAKFDNEKESESIRRAIQRYEIEHPVINDSNMLVWRKFGVRAWPSMVLLDPEGYYCGYLSGEGNRELLDAVLGKVIEYHKFKGTLDETPVRFDLERAKLKPTPLRFPGKLLVDEANGRLFVSDSNHNRIVISSLDGKLLETIGTGAIGATDGAYDKVSFDHPQGMALVGDTLYVADTENHMIRAVDLKKKQVKSLAGTGEQARFRSGGGSLRETALNSPWALMHVDGNLFVAMAGPHQIWNHKLGSKTIQVFAGSGREDIQDGPLLESAFAQPSGIATDGKFLYIADSEGSSIRKVSVDPKGEVTTVVGSSNLPNGRCLFEFGDRDGVGGDARLQHPLGVALKGDTLYVADAFNHKIKRINLKTREATTWLGDGKPGTSLSPPQFSEPEGLAIGGDTLYVADTNNHRVCAVALKTGKVREFVIDGLKPPGPIATDAGDLALSTNAVKVAPQAIAAGELLQFEIALGMPDGFKLNKLAPVTFKLKAAGDQELVAAENLNARQRAKAADATATITVPLAKKSGKGTLELSLSYRYCRNGVGGLCKLQTTRWLIPVEVKDGAKQTVIKLKSAASK